MDGLEKAVIYIQKKGKAVMQSKSRVRKSHEIERISGGKRRKSCGRERSGGLVMRAGQIMGYYRVSI